MAKKFLAQRLEGIKGMNYAPVNEQGVVYLFALLANKLGFKGIEKIQTGFPDALARRRVNGGEEIVPIEFEYKSSSYRTHRHPRRKGLCLVCWIHDWANIPAGIEVVELRKECGLGFDAWVQGVWPEYWGGLDHFKNVEWSVPSGAKPGDIIIFYRTRPAMCIQEIYQQITSVREDKKWKYRANLRRVCQLKSPLNLEHMRQVRGIATAGFIRGNLQGRRNVTAHWPTLYDLIVKLNPSLAKSLKRYAPSKL